MTPSPESTERRKCERRGEALAWLQGELPPDRDHDYGRHIDECPPCAEFVADAREMLERLHDEAVAQRHPDSGRGSVLRSASRALSDVERRILLRCTPGLAVLQGQARRRARLGALAAAAVLLMTVSAHLSLQVLRGGADPASSKVAAAADLSPAVAASAASADWIAEHLGPDGRFDAASWSAPRADEVAMHGFALLALARADGGSGGAHDSSRDDDVLRGARWLLGQQGADGTIGEAGVGSGFDHAVASVALLEASAITGDASVRSGAERAVARLVASQLADGGWQPHALAHGCNPTSTAWALQALLRADQLAVPELRTPIARGRARLAADLGGLWEPAGLNLAAVSQLAIGLPSTDTAAAGTPDVLACGPVAARAVAGAGRALGDLYAASVMVLATIPAPR